MATVIGLFVCGVGLIGLCTRLLGAHWEEESRGWPPWYDGPCPACSDEPQCSCGEGV